METYERQLDLREAAAQKSIFLYGPRQTGKTFLLKKTFPNAPCYNLLKSDVFLRLSQRPSAIREALKHGGPGNGDPIIIDEIQKLPALLDEVHTMIEDSGKRFILTGSSPRKLKRSGANLLGGRAWTRHLMPLVRREIPSFDLLRVLNYGAIPSVYQSTNPVEDLLAYCGDYLQQEVQAEGAVRNVESFSRFLQTASLVDTELLNSESVGSDCGVPPRTIREYFAILEDTLLGVLLKPYRRTRHRKAVATSKFYFFDIGVSNALAGRKGIQPKTELFGKAFEHFIFTEIRAWLEYSRDRRPLCFWRSQDGNEVDFVIGDETAIEVKSTELAGEKHLRGLKVFSEEVSLKRKIVVSQDSAPRRIGDVDILPLEVFLSALWDGQL